VRVLIFGGTGQVGRALQQCVPDRTCLDVFDRSACDLTDLVAVRSAILLAKPDIVINAAAYTAVDKAEVEPELAQIVNSVAAGEIAEAAFTLGARCVHISTDFVFDGSLSRPYLPSDAATPLNVYGKTKLNGELAVIGANPDALIIRTSWIYASHGNNFMKTMLRLMRERDEISVVADQVGTPTHSLSLARAIWPLAASNLRGICHFTDAGVASWYDFAVAIAEEALAIGLLDKPVIVRPISTWQYPTPAQRPAYSVLDKSTAWEALGASSDHWRLNLRAALKELKING
jgi:dTDP-4-dehydrorhamnose reductase